MHLASDVNIFFVISNLLLLFLFSSKNKTNHHYFLTIPVPEIQDIVYVEVVKRSLVLVRSQ